MTDAALGRLSLWFERLHSTIGRPSIPLERLLRALLLQMLYSIRSERLLMEELDYSVLYRWFVGLSLDDPIWDATTFTKNRDRLLDGDLPPPSSAKCWPRSTRMDCCPTSISPSMAPCSKRRRATKSLKPRGATGKPPDDPKNPSVSFHGQQRPNDTHQSPRIPTRGCPYEGATYAYLVHNCVRRDAHVSRSTSRLALGRRAWFEGCHGLSSRS